MIAALTDTLQRISASYERVLMKLYEGWRVAQESCGDPVHGSWMLVQIIGLFD